MMYGQITTIVKKTIFHMITMSKVVQLHNSERFALVEEFELLSVDQAQRSPYEFALGYVLLLCQMLQVFV